MFQVYDLQHMAWNRHIKLLIVKVGHCTEYKFLKGLEEVKCDEIPKHNTLESFIFLRTTACFRCILLF